MRIRLAIPDRLVTPQILEAALEATTLANQAAIEAGEVPTVSDLISKGAKWKEEPFVDGEHFDLLDQVARRGWGDCDDLAPGLAGELRATGEDPGARARVHKTGPDRWHVVTETSDGHILDPSRWAGMGRRSARDAQGVRAALAKPMARIGGGAIACIPGPGGWWARCDIPFGDTHLASHARGRTADQAVERAVSGAVCCGEHCGCDRVAVAGSFLLGDAAESLGPLVGGTSILPLKEQLYSPYMGKAFNRKLLARVKNDYENAWNNGQPYVNDLVGAPFVPRERFPDFETFWQWALKQPTKATTHQKGMGFVKKAIKTVAPMAANLLAPGAGTALSALTQGGPPPNLLSSPAGMIERDPRTGAISVPLDNHGDHHMFMMYHPLGAPGPVVMRF